jgi:hypothetical protein
MLIWTEFLLRPSKLTFARPSEFPLADSWFDDCSEEFLMKDWLTPLKVVCKLPTTPTQKEIQGEA